MPNSKRNNAVIAEVLAFCITEAQYDEEAFVEFAVRHARDRAPPSAVPRLKQIFADVYLEAVHLEALDEELDVADPFGENPKIQHGFQCVREMHLDFLMSLMSEFAALQKGRRASPVAVMKDLRCALVPQKNSL